MQEATKRFLKESQIKKVNNRTETLHQVNLSSVLSEQTSIRYCNGLPDPSRGCGSLSASPEFWERRIEPSQRQKNLFDFRGKRAANITSTPKLSAELLPACRHPAALRRVGSLSNAGWRFRPQLKHTKTKTFLYFILRNVSVFFAESIIKVFLCVAVSRQR